jgi:hypothetical protein
LDRHWQKEVKGENYKCFIIYKIIMHPYLLGTNRNSKKKQNIEAGLK